MSMPIGTGSYVWWRCPSPSAAPGWSTFAASGSPYVSLAPPSRVKPM
jgi:hypothetical protein